MLDPGRVVACFVEYMHREGHPVSRAQFEQNLHDKQSDVGFLHEVKPLLRAGVEYDAAAAITRVREVLIDKLPGDPWRGPADHPSSVPKPRSRRKRP